MTWELTPDHLLVYQNHKQTHDDAITVVAETAESVTLRGPQGTQEMTLLPDGRLEMKSPQFGRIVLKRAH
jgi:hypothetical protein